MAAAAAPPRGAPASARRAAPAPADWLPPARAPRRDWPSRRGARRHVGLGAAAAAGAGAEQRGGGGGGRDAAEAGPPPALLPRAPGVPGPQLLPGPQRGAGAAALPPRQGRHRRALQRAGLRPGEPHGPQPRAARGRQGHLRPHLPGLGLLPDGHAGHHRHQPVRHVQLPGAVPGGAAAAGGPLHRLPGAGPGAGAARRALPRRAGAAGQHARGVAGALRERAGLPQRPQLPLHEHAGGVRRSRHHHQRGGQVSRFLPQRRRAGELGPGPAARRRPARRRLAAGRPELPAENVADDPHLVPVQPGGGALQRPAPRGPGGPAPDLRPAQAALPLPGQGQRLPAVHPAEGLPDLPGLLHPAQHRPQPPHAPGAARGRRAARRRRARARAARTDSLRPDLQRGPGREGADRAAGQGRPRLEPPAALPVRGAAASRRSRTPASNRGARLRLETRFLPLPSPFPVG